MKSTSGEDESLDYVKCPGLELISGVISCVVSGSLTDSVM